MEVGNLAVDILQFMKKYPLPRCKPCRENNVLHCVHRVVPNLEVNAEAQCMFDKREDLANKLWLAKCQAENDAGAVAVE